VDDDNILFLIQVDEKRRSSHDLEVMYGLIVFIMHQSPPPRILHIVMWPSILPAGRLGPIPDYVQRRPNRGIGTKAQRLSRITITSRSISASSFYQQK